MVGKILLITLLIPLIVIFHAQTTKSRPSRLIKRRLQLLRKLPKESRRISSHPPFRPKVPTRKHKISDNLRMWSAMGQISCHEYLRYVVRYYAQPQASIHHSPNARPVKNHIQRNSLSFHERPTRRASSRKSK